MGCGGSNIDQETIKVAYYLPAMGNFEDPCTSEDIKICQDSWKIICEGTADVYKEAKKQNKNYTPESFFYTTFFNRLFSISPETRGMFKGDLEKQGKLLFKIFGWVLGIFELTDRDVELGELAQRHVTYKIQPFHYTFFMMALTDTHKKVLGDHYSKEVLKGWTAVLSVIMKIMIDTAVKNDVMAECEIDAFSSNEKK